MKEKLLVIMLSTLILSPYFISANEGKKENVGYKNSYNLYTKTIFFFGEKTIHDNFTTPPDCKKIGVSARVGEYFTGYAGIWIKVKIIHGMRITPYGEQAGMYLENLFIPSCI